MSTEHGAIDVGTRRRNSESPEQRSTESLESLEQLSGESLESPDQRSPGIRVTGSTVGGMSTEGGRSDVCTLAGANASHPSGARQSASVYILSCTPILLHTALCGAHMPIMEANKREQLHRKLRELRVPIDDDWTISCKQYTRRDGSKEVRASFCHPRHTKGRLIRDLGVAFCNAVCHRQVRQGQGQQGRSSQNPESSHEHMLLDDQSDSDGDFDDDGEDEEDAFEVRCSCCIGHWSQTGPQTELDAADADDGGGYQAHEAGPIQVLQG